MVNLTFDGRKITVKEYTTIMEAAAQMRRVTQGIGEMVTYLLYNRDILYAESGDDIFHLYYSLAVDLSR